MLCCQKRSSSLVFAFRLEKHCPDREESTDPARELLYWQEALSSSRSSVERSSPRYVTMQEQLSRLLALLTPRS